MYVYTYIYIHILPERGSQGVCGRLLGCVLRMCMGGAYIYTWYIYIYIYIHILPERGSQGVWGRLLGCAKTQRGGHCTPAL